jgi:thymidylate synthase (FAD)
MKIIEPSFDIVSPVTREDGISMLRSIEFYARISHRTEERMGPDTWERFIKAVVVDKGDWSVCEHVIVTVIARVDRGVSHEWVRHRIGSYTQESTRFVNYKKVGEIDVIRPEGLKPEDESVWVESIAKACWGYTVLMDRGAMPQMARSVLPNALATTLAVTYNLRSWRQFFMMRSTRESHPDMRRIVLPLLEEFKKRIPLLYDDIIPEEKQSISLSKPR